MDESENDNTKGSFTFVLIPTANETLREVRKSKAGGADDDELHKFAAVYYGYSNGSQDGRLEVTGLDIPRPANNHTYVTMYTDKNAQAKKKPVNKRATSLVSACRTFTNLIYGDAIVGRTFNDNKYHDKSNW